MGADLKSGCYEEIGGSEEGERPTLDRLNLHSHMHDVRSPAANVGDHDRIGREEGDRFHES